jgi:putative transposase
MKFRLIEDRRDTFPVRAMCDVLGVSPSRYYAWRSHSESHRKPDNRALLAEIRRVHAAHRGRYGAPRGSRDLARRGAYGEPRPRRTAHAPSWHPATNAATVSGAHHGQPSRFADRAEFARTDLRGPNQVWLAADRRRMALSGRRIGSLHQEDRWLVDARSPARRTRHRCLVQAIQRQRPAPDLIHHSDRGSQYAAADYRKGLNEAGLVQSMSRKGNCWDNAPRKLLWNHENRTCSPGPLSNTRCRPARLVRLHRIGQRLHSALGYITPEQAERQVA